MKIHLIGVGGAAMGNLASMLKEAGHTVTGSDTALYPPMSDKLRERGIAAYPFDAKNVRGVDLCIIGNVISRGNPEAEAVLNENIPYTSMAQAVSRFFLQGKNVIVVAGTHGKTTTTFLIDHILCESGETPGLFAGGIRADGQDGYRLSKSPYFVIEGDEYDTAFFDKASKFLHYRPRILVLTSVQFDHADIFKNTQEYRTAFRRLLRLIPSEGYVAACVDDAGVREVLSGYSLSEIGWYGSARKGYSTETFQRNGREVEFPYIGKVPDFALIGNHNTANALAAVLVAQKLNLPADRVKKALQNFPGVMRRQQIRACSKTSSEKNSGGVLLIEDFAHHPFAVRCTIQAVRQAYPGRTIHALFEPRSATSHRKIFQKAYESALSLADCVYLCDVFNKSKVSPELLLDVPRISSGILQKKNKKNSDKKRNIQKYISVWTETPQALVNEFKEKFTRSQKGDVILVMSNGAFGGIYPELDRFVEAMA